MSHFTLLTSLEMPQIPDTTPDTAPISAPSTAMQLLEKCIGKQMRSSLDNYVDSALEPIMEPFWESTNEPEYLEFILQDEHESYDNDSMTCVQMPNGTIIGIYDYPFREKFTVKDGLVYQRNFGQLHTEKRSKATKKMKVLELPVKQRYASYDEYMKNYHGYQYDANSQGYGYYSNPNAQWDWYQIGGRWPFCFLVKEDCLSKVYGERSWGWNDEEYTAAQRGPDGYIWVAGAKKSDIAWDVMKDLAVKRLTEEFYILERWMATGEKPEGISPLHNMTDDGIYNWGSLVYSNGESLEQYLERTGHGEKLKYAFSTYAYLTDGTWYAKGDMGWFAISTNEKTPTDWHAMVDSFIDSIPDDHLLVSVDCHI